MTILPMGWRESYHYYGQSSVTDSYETQCQYLFLLGLLLEVQTSLLISHFRGTLLPCLGNNLCHIFYSVASLVHLGSILVHMYNHMPHKHPFSQDLSILYHTHSKHNCDNHRHRDSDHKCNYPDVMLRVHTRSYVHMSKMIKQVLLDCWQLF